MFKNLMLCVALAMLAACASRQPEPEPDAVPPPVEITESSEPAAPTPPPDQPPPPAEPPADAPGKPAQTDSGRFRIAIASVDSAEGTAGWVRKAEDAGYRTETLAVEIDGKTWHRILLPGYASLAEAQAALPFVQQELNAPGAWVTSRLRAPFPAGADAPPPPAEAPPAETPPAEATPTPK
jgi:septal ring-binding cell division protein DamX